MLARCCPFPVELWGEKLPERLEFTHLPIYWIHLQGYLQLYVYDKNLLTGPFLDVQYPALASQ
jgi:hypothetical protein